MRFMRILVDAHGLSTPQKTGKHYYTHSLLAALAPNHQLIYFSSPVSGLFYYLHLWLHLLTHRYDLLLLPLSYLPILFSPLPTITIVYDLAFRHTTDFLPNRKAAILERLFLPLVVRRSRGLIFLNRHLPRELNRPLPPHTIIPGISRLSPATSSARPYPFPYLLFVGTLEPRKNIPGLLHAYRRLLDQLPHPFNPPKLVIVGKKGWYYQTIFDTVTQLNLTESVVFAGYVPDHKLANLYRYAEFFVYLPFYEGFGLPIIEALSFNQAVITSNLPVLRDTLGPCGLTVDPHNHDQIAAALLRFTTSPETKSAYQTPIPAWLSHFTPRITAQKFDRLLKTMLLGPLSQTHPPATPPPNS